jgi:hypothetical protein
MMPQGASALRFPRGNLGCSTPYTEVVAEMAAGALRFAKGAEGPWYASADPDWPRATQVEMHLPPVCVM